MDIIKKNFGERLKYIRNIKGFTQEKLAESIGINLRQLARIEAGESFITAETLCKICTTFEISPSILFDFSIQKELLMTGTDNKVHFGVIKSGNIIQLVSKESISNTSEYNMTEEDDKMLKLAQRTGKDIIVDEYKDGKVYETKIYRVSGQIEINGKIEKTLYSIVKEKVSKISEDNKKLEFVNLAYDSLSNKECLEKLKLLIQGLELSL